MSAAGIGKCCACFCINPSFEDAVTLSDEVFLGTVLRYERLLDGHNVLPDGDTIQFWKGRYYFSIDRKWKGTEDALAVIDVFLNGCDDGFDVMREGNLVYANNTNKFISHSDFGNDIPLLESHFCSRSSKPGGPEGENWYYSDRKKLDLMPVQLLRKDYLAIDEPDLVTMTHGSILKMTTAALAIAVLILSWLLIRKT